MIILPSGLSAEGISPKPWSFRLYRSIFLVGVLLTLAQIVSTLLLGLPPFSNHQEPWPIASPLAYGPLSLLAGGFITVLWVRFYVWSLEFAPAYAKPIPLGPTGWTVATGMMMATDQWIIWRMGSFKAVVLTLVLIPFLWLMMYLGNALAHLLWIPRLYALIRRKLSVKQPH